MDRETHAMKKTMTLVRELVTDKAWEMLGEDMQNQIRHAKHDVHTKVEVNYEGLKFVVVFDAQMGTHRAEVMWAQKAPFFPPRVPKSFDE